MQRRFRLLGVLKWTGMPACGLTVLTAIACLRWSVAGSVANWTIGTAFGGLWATPCNLRGPSAGSWLHLRPVSLRELRDEYAKNAIWPRFNVVGYRITVVPLWISFFVLAITTAWLWHLDRRRPRPGRCRCGSNLTGNTSGRCPECGASTERAA